MDTTKIIVVFVLAMFLMTAVVPMVLAQDDSTEDEETEVPAPGITPDSPLYGLDNAMDRLRLALTFDKAKRAERALKISEERLAEVKAMIEEIGRAHV